MMQHRKKIVIFYSRLLEAGGAERVALEEARYFSRNYDTELFTFILEPEALFEYKDLKIFNFSFPNDNRYFKPAQTLRRIISLARELKTNNTDLVIACSTAGILELYFATLIRRIPYVLHIHGTIFWFEEDNLKYALIFRPVFNCIRQSVIGHNTFIPQKRYQPFLQKLQTELLAILNYKAVRRAKTVLVLSNHMKWEVQKLYRKDSLVTPVILIPSDFRSYQSGGKTRDKLHISDKEQVILSISRLDPRKRIDILIRAFARICNDFKTTLIIGGKGPEENRLRNLADKLGISDNVKFVGFIPEDQLLDYYAACDIFAYPGWADFALTVYEALAQLKKVVCSSEMEIPSSDIVFKVDPRVEDFAIGLRKAINTCNPAEDQIKEMTKFDYFKEMQNVIDRLLEGR